MWGAGSARAGQVGCGRGLAGGRPRCRPCSVRVLQVAAGGVGVVLEQNAHTRVSVVKDGGRKVGKGLAKGGGGEAPRRRLGATGWQGKGWWRGERKQEEVGGKLMQGGRQGARADLEQEGRHQPRPRRQAGAAAPFRGRAGARAAAPSAGAAAIITLFTSRASRHGVAAPVAARRHSSSAAPRARVASGPRAGPE